MQQINAERQQLPANIITETTSPTHQKHVNKNAKSIPNRFDRIAGDNQRQSPSQRLQTNLGDFDTYRSLSTCPTYSSLSRHSPETRECATQITTLTPIETIEDNQEISDDSLLPIDDNPILLVDEVELMPISSGFGNYPYDYPTTKTQRVVPPQIVSRALQFRSNQRDKNQKGFNLNFNNKPNGKLPPAPPPRPTAVRRSPRSDTFSLPTKRNEINSKVPKKNPIPNGFRRIPPIEHVRSPTPPPSKRRAEPVYRDNVARPAPKYLTSPVDQEDYGRKPVRFANKRNNAHYTSPPPPPAYHQKSAPLSQNALEKSRRMRVANNDYVIERRRQAPSDYTYDDYRTDSPIERTRPQRLVRVLRDAPYREDDDVYYVEPAPSRRAPIVRKSPPTEYVYVDETPAQIRHRRRPPPARRQEVVYIDEDQPGEYEDEYIYVDDDGNEVDFTGERNQSPQYVEYIYDDENDKRRSHKAKVIYVEDDAPINQGRNKKKSKQPSSTRIVYE